MRLPPELCARSTVLDDERRAGSARRAGRDVVDHVVVGAQRLGVTAHDT